MKKNPSTSKGVTKVSRTEQQESFTGTHFHESAGISIRTIFHDFHKFESTLVVVICGVRTRGHTHESYSF